MRAGRHELLIEAALLTVACLRAASPIDSTTDARLLRIQQSVAGGDMGGARSELNELARIAPRDARIYNLLGVIDARENRFAAAESNFRHAIALAPRFVGAYMNLGRLYQEHASKQGTGDKAVDVYLRLLAFAPENVEANYQAASVLSRAGKFSQSLEHLQRLPPDAQQRAAAIALRCANHAALGHRAEANAAENQLLAASDLAEMDVLTVAPILQAHDAGDIATRLLETISARGRASPAGLQALAALQEKQGRLQQARESLERDLQLEPPSAPVLMNLARLAYRAKDLEAALGYLAHARDLEPANAAIHYCFGLICVDLKLPPEARQSLQEAVRLDPENPYYNYALGAVLLQQKDAEAAIERFRKYCENKPRDPRGRLALGVAYFDAYDVEAAKKELQFAAAHQETRSGANLYLGRLALRNDELHEAAERLREAIAGNPSSPDGYAELAAVHLRRNEFEPAQDALARALEIAPDHYRSNLTLLVLYQRMKDKRALEQGQRVEVLRRAGEERERALLRTLDLRPY